jgi:hypothetical protein
MNEQQAREMLTLLRRIELNTATLAAAYNIRIGDLRSYRKRAEKLAGDQDDDA